MNDIVALKVHPFADIFPMLPDDDLNELAADIAENGQEDAIILNKDGLLIDGRNRLEACRRAGIEPRFEQRDVPDPVAYILTKNVQRRNINKSQRAMIVATAYPEAQIGRPRAGSEKVQNSSGVSADYVTKARLILKHNRDAAPLVLAGTMKLADAYAEAVVRRDRVASHGDRFERLKAAAPDLAAKVADEEMTLDEAEHEELSRRQAEAAEEAESRRVASVAVGHLSTVLTLTGSLNPGEPAQRASDWLAQVGKVRASGGHVPTTVNDMTREQCRYISSVFASMARVLKEKPDG